MAVVTNRLAGDSSDSDDPFDALFLAHYERVYGLLVRIVGDRTLAEDLVQEVFLTLHQNPPKGRDCNMGAWLYRVATNAGYNAVRERNRRERRHLKLAPLVESAQDPARQVMIDEERTAVRRVLAELRPEQGQLLLLRQMGLSYRELAVACDVPASSVGQLLARASRAFKFGYLRLTQERNHA